jgi:Mg2+/Co2+ transporter CorB
VTTGGGATGATGGATGVTGGATGVTGGATGATGGTTGGGATGVVTFFILLFNPALMKKNTKVATTEEVSTTIAIIIRTFILHVHLLHLERGRKNTTFTLKYIRVVNEQATV